MKKIVWTFGLIAGAALSAMFLVLWPFHDQLSGDAALAVGYTTMVAAFLLAFFGAKQYRDNVAGGSISFGKAFQVAGLITLIASACYVATWEVMYFGGFADGYFEKYSEQVVAKSKAEGKPQAEIDKEVADLKVWAERYKNPAINVAMTFMEPLPVALAMSLLSAALLRRRENRSAQHA